MNISSTFDGGNIHCIDCSDPSDVRLEIVKDAHSDFYQWFYFRATDALDQDCVFKLTNAAGAAYAAGWNNYEAVASYDRELWFRVETEYRDGILSIHHTPQENAIYYAFFAPYSMERHADFIADVLQSEWVTYRHLAHTLDGQDLDLLTVGDSGPDKKTCWIIARQHPGETMAEWWMEGFLRRLLDPDEPVARKLLQKAVFHIVPNMNPDGSRRGHLRTNAAGANLNREWCEPSQERSPEVLAVRKYMHATGVDLCLDVHGDEELPHCFIAGAESIPGWNTRLDALTQRFKQTYANTSPDFQCKVGYPLARPGSSDLKKCTDYVAQTFDCLAMTLEMPFKDNADLPDPDHGWSPERCQHLGAAALNALVDIVDDLR